MNMIKNIYWSLVALFLLPLGKIFAQTFRADIDNNGSGGTSFTFDSPLNVTGGIQGLVAKILEVVVLIGTPVAVLFIMYSGFLYVTARGNGDKVKDATRAFTWAVIGTAILIGAQVIANVLGGTIEQIVQ